MLLQRSVLERISTGEVTLVFRRWLRPTVRTGGTLKTVLGVLAIDAVAQVTAGSITEEEARAAGFPDRRTLLLALSQRDGDLYRIAVHHAGDDPRVALRQQSELSPEELAELRRRLERFDASSLFGPWTQAALRAIARRPAVLAARLAKELGQPTVVFKRNVRKLKELGLTESLEVGYRLSPRGQRLLDGLEAPAR